MQKTRVLTPLSFRVCMMVLIAALALLTTGCNGNPDPMQEPGVPAQTEQKVLGEGGSAFTFLVTGPDGNETAYEVHTDQKTVGGALTELGLLEGEEGPYGLYVKTVDGITLDYDADGRYWAFYIDSKYASSGVDVTEVTAGAVYAFRAEEA